MRFPCLALLFSAFMLGCNPINLTESSTRNQGQTTVHKDSNRKDSEGLDEPSGVKDNISQAEEGSVEICTQLLLNEISNETSDVSRVVRVTSINSAGLKISPELEEWLATDIHKELLVTFVLDDEGKKALILRANVAGATGIAANYTNWFVQLNHGFLNFRSLSEEPKLIYWDDEGALNYYVVEYGEDFLYERDWDNLTLDVSHFIVNRNNYSELISKDQNIFCE